MAERSERVLRFVENYVTDWKSGMVLTEIAAKYSISRRRAYEVLDEIAEKSGIDRKALLERPHYKEHSNRGVPKNKKHSTLSIDIQEVKQEMDDMIGQGKIILKDIEKILNDIQQEENNNGN